MTKQKDGMECGVTFGTERKNSRTEGAMRSRAVAVGMSDATSAINEIERIPCPCPGPVGLAVDGNTLWVGSGETYRIYGIDAHQGTVFEETSAPAKPYGMCVVGDALRVIVAEPETDNRAIHRYVIGNDFKADTVRCPSDTGSFLTYDGDAFFVSQRFDQQIVEIDGNGVVLRTIQTPRQVTGLTVVAGKIYCVTTIDTKSSDYRLHRVDARGENATWTELATIPFFARSLGFDGTRFWTHDRDKREIVAFAKPD